MNTVSIVNAGLILLLAGCSAANDAASSSTGGAASRENQGTKSSDAGDTGQEVTGSDAQPTGTALSLDASALTPVDGGADGEVEVCDGIDNDHNGQIDDVDVGHDGVCDCLLIATLGHEGYAGKSDLFSAWLNARASNGATALTDQLLSHELIDKFQIIIVQDIRPAAHRGYSAAEIGILHEWLKAGGGLMTLTGYWSFELNNVNAIIQPLGVWYDGKSILYGGGATVPVTQWVPHPITDKIEQIGIDNGYPVLGGGTLLAQGIDGGQAYDVARAVQVGEGRLFVWGDEWITYDSEWANHPEYEVHRFWLNLLKWLSPDKECQVEIPETIR